MTANPPLDESEYRRWRAEAEHALGAARVQSDAGFHNWACCGAEQAAQLGAKALLHGFGRAPWGHDLVELGRLLSKLGFEAPEPVEQALRRLSRHYIPARYPDAYPSGPPHAHYGGSESEEALGDATAILLFVDDCWESARA